MSNFKEWHFFRQLVEELLLYHEFLQVINGKWEPGSCDFCRGLENLDWAVYLTYMKSITIKTHHLNGPTRK